MSEYEMKVDIEPKNNYEKAKLDLIKAYNSISILSKEDRIKLVCEVAKITGCDIAFKSH